MAVQLVNVCKAFGDNQVLDHFHLQLPDQGTVALMGPSGCGKTTLLRLMAGLESPDSGQLLLPSPLRLSMVFQEDRLLEVLTARENLLAVLEAGKEDRADLWLEQLGLQEAGDLYPSQMSGGMRRRVAIARAMAYEGNLLLLDEPFQGLDHATREKVMACVFSPVEGRLTVLVTHSLREAKQVADTIIQLKGPLFP